METMSNIVKTPEVVASVDVGKSGILSARRTLCFNFHRFANMKHKCGKNIISPDLQCHGQRWAIILYPGGKRTSSKKDDVLISVYLKRCLNKGQEKRKIEAKFSMQAGRTKTKSTTFVFGKDETVGYGWKDFAKRANVLDESQNYLVEGTLTIKVDIQVYLDKPEEWIPGTGALRYRRMLEMFNTGEYSDVEFMVGDNQFRAHKFMLAASAPTLMHLAEDMGEDTAIRIDDVDPSLFEKILRFIYSEELPRNFKNDAKDLLDVADKFGCVNLKLIAEKELATNGINKETTAEMFLLADCKNCALLKEVTTQYFVANANEVMKTKGFSQVRESPKLLAELMEALADPPSFSDVDETDINRMGVSALRRKLDEAGLDVDGTREMLVKRLNLATKSN